ncbi:2-hydroxyacid dehydrogenase [Inhella gelatinilytica]|uniref:2-hydroxyacid dehydrogenase n=1 Tax=Inhella gelatinilytica TaxID=2795030 RepID=A0A931IY91_9BURK|nr:2-hydroxyacid dehydrogenase [Inhella gelatinilytica]MBH9553274.1 2-hydroxyacid dehydrogenase [Inhella gelatinilytica]
MSSAYPHQFDERAPFRVAFFSTKRYDRTSFSGALTALKSPVVFEFLEARLEVHSASAAAGCHAVCAFVNDDLSAAVLEQLAAQGVRLVLLRCAGFNHVDLDAARRLGLRVARVPEYSPHAVAEHTLALLLTLIRKTHRAHARVREGNFELDGLLGFDLFGKTVGVVGTGRIGRCVVNLFKGLGCDVVAHDPMPDPGLGVRYVTLGELLSSSRVVLLQCPLTAQTHHLVNAQSLARLQRGTILVNTSRGAVVDTPAAIAALKSGQLGGLAIDVYEEEAELFFDDHSGEVIADDVFARLTTFPNVLITAHQAFFTEEALSAIAQTTLANAEAFAVRGEPLHAVA